MDNKAIQDLVSWRPQMIAFTVKLCKDPVIAEDLVGDCYCKILERIDKIDTNVNFKAYVFLSLKNFYINHYRSSKKKVFYDLEDKWNIIEIVLGSDTINPENAYCAK